MPELRTILTVTAALVAGTAGLLYGTLRDATGWTWSCGG